MTCRLDHGADASIPEFLCRICHPNLNHAEPIKASAIAPEPERRDFRIPKGMSTEEGNRMLLVRKIYQQAKKDEALVALKEKHAGEFYDTKLKAWFPNSAKGEK